MEALDDLLSDTDYEGARLKRPSEARPVAAGLGVFDDLLSDSDGEGGSNDEFRSLVAQMARSHLGADARFGGFEDELCADSALVGGLDGSARGDPRHGGHDDDDLDDEELDHRADRQASADDFSDPGVDQEADDGFSDGGHFRGVGGLTDDNEFDDGGDSRGTVGFGNPGTGRPTGFGRFATDFTAGLGREGDLHFDVDEGDDFDGDDGFSDHGDDVAGGDAGDAGSALLERLPMSTPSFDDVREAGRASQQSAGGGGGSEGEAEEQRPKQRPNQRPQQPEELDDLIEKPISASGKYSLERAPAAVLAFPASEASVTSATSTALPEDAVGTRSAGNAGNTSNASAKARPFLRKGARMPRSDLPRDGTNVTTKPIANPPAPNKKQLRLQPRSSSEPAGTRPGPSRASVPRLDFAQVDDADEADSLRLGLGLAEEDEEDFGAGAAAPSWWQRDAGRPASGASGRQAAPPPAAPTKQASRTADGDAAGSGYRGQAPCRKPSEDDWGDAGFEDEWADSKPWDCRGLDLDLELELDAPTDRVRTQQPSMSGVPPTSSVVKNYFHSASGSSLPREAPATKQGPAPARGPAGPSHSATRHPHWEGGDAYSTLYGRAAPSATLRGVAETPAKREPASSETSPLEEEAKLRLAALDQQVRKYERENELLKKLQAQAEQTERELGREREKLWREVEAEKRALHAEFDVERAALKKERKRLSQGAERQRQLLLEDREAQEERRRLQQRSEELEESMREKEKRWQRTVDRLQRQIADLTRKNQELQDEVRVANQQAQQAQLERTWQDQRRSVSANASRSRRPGGSVTAAPLAPRAGVATTLGPQEMGPGRARSTGTQGTPASAAAPAPRGLEFLAPPRGTAAPARRASSVVSDCSSVDGLMPSQGPPFGESPQQGQSGLQGQMATSAPSRPQGPAREGVSTNAAAASSTGGVPKGTAATQAVQEVRSFEGRTERVFVDGRREVEFVNGLRKVIWPDGRTSVLFQNGDHKEIHADGVVVYHYQATGAVQTTLPDGTELYHFVDGQFERHGADGSKEIRFPNGTSKRIFADGSEEVAFADGTVRRTPAARPA